MLGQDAVYHEVHWFWSNQYHWNLLYAGFHTSWEQLVVRGDLNSDSFLARYMNAGRIDRAVIGVNRGKRRAPHHPADQVAAHRGSRSAA